jgi:hypothetical protein
MQLIRLLLLLFVAVKVVERFAGWFHTEIDYTWFWIGIAAAAVVAFADFMINNWWSTVTRPTHPQTVSHSTNETPSQITRASFWAIIQGILVIVLVGFIISQVLSLP